MHLDNVSVENSENDGIVVSGSKRSTMKNCNVSHSKWSGLVVNGGGLMTIDGNATTIHHNCTNGDSSCTDDYGLHTGISSAIHLVSPLTKETISTGNEGCRHYGGAGTIKSVDTDGKVLEVVYDGRPDEEEEEDDY